MKKFLIILLYLSPFCVSAHAVPTSYMPAHGANVSVSPPEVIVSFTDRVDPGTAALILHRATGTPRQLAAYVDQDDPRTLHAPLPSGEGGVTIMWGVTSLDDGHYTRGAFNFSVTEKGKAHLAPAKKTIDETYFVTFLLTASGILVVLHIVSLVFLDKKPRSRTCMYSYALLEIVIGAAMLLASLMLFSTPLLPEWKTETQEDGINITLHTQQGSPEMYLTVESREPLPAPLFEVSNRDATIDPMPIAITPLVSPKGKDEGTTYSFPASIFIPYGNWHVSTTFVRGNHYDAHGAMVFTYPDDVLSALQMSPIHSRGAWGALGLSLLTLFLVAWRVWGLVKKGRKDSMSIG